MPNFIKELKALRKKQEISLDEINERTKISLSSLKSIEKGNFDELPITYIRLFLKAYACEIGVDPLKTLKEFDEYISPKNNSDLINNSNDNYKNQNSISKKIEKLKSPKKIRSDLIKSIILVVIFIFTIYIIKSVVSEREAAKPPVYKSEFEEEGPITFEILNNEFNKEGEITKKLNIPSPYKLKIASDQRIWFSYSLDNKSNNENILPSGDNKIFEFNKSIKIIFKHSFGLSLNINNIDLNIPQSIISPIVINFNSNDSIINITTFSPKN